MKFIVTTRIKIYIKINTAEKFTFDSIEIPKCVDWIHNLDSIDVTSDISFKKETKSF